jgi:hypothetical protein
MDPFLLLREDALDAELCAELIERFERHPDVAPGRAGAVVDARVKQSLDLALVGRAEFAALLPRIGGAIEEALLLYLRQHPLLLLSSVAISFRDPATGLVEALDAARLAQLSEASLRSLARSFFRCGEMNLQKYLRGEGGYFAWHTEISPADPSGEKLHRVLPVLIYLNDVEEGGETEFHYTQTKIRPRRGTLALWPAYFQHTHRGLVPRSSDKYVIASWVLFQRAASQARA